MTQVYFHCSTNTNEVLVDCCGAVVDDLAEARDHAARVVRSLTTARNLEDLRGWVLHVNDDLGDELFVVPFAFVLGKPH
jgi:sirohydrochlorin ferrochelatase